MYILYTCRVYIKEKKIKIKRLGLLYRYLLYGCARCIDCCRNKRSVLYQISTPFFFFYYYISCCCCSLPPLLVIVLLYKGKKKVWQINKPEQHWFSTIFLCVFYMRLYVSMYTYVQIYRNVYIAHSLFSFCCCCRTKNGLSVKRLPPRVSWHPSNYNQTGIHINKAGYM